MIVVLGFLNTHADQAVGSKKQEKPSKGVRQSRIFLSLKSSKQGFPGGAVVENLPASAGDTSSSPDVGGSHMPRSGWALEPQLLSLRVWSLCSATREAAIVRGPPTAMRSGPCLPRLERALAQRRGPNIDKKKKD